MSTASEIRGNLSVESVNENENYIFPLGNFPPRSATEDAKCVVVKVCKGPFQTKCITLCVTLED